MTKKQFSSFKVLNAPVKWVETDDSPAMVMTWYEAAEYCNWLSEREGIRPDQQCYEPFPSGMRAKKGYLKLTGYRLPTEAEWEFACRAGSTARFFFGQSESLLKHYAWYVANGEKQTHAVGSLKPNDFGLFDMHGNVWCFCGSSYQPYPHANGGIVEDDGATDTGPDVGRLVIRGGAYRNQADLVRAAYRGYVLPTDRQPLYDFRPARTID